MNYIELLTVSPEGIEQTFIQECHTNDMAVCIISATLNACASTNWTLKKLVMS